MTSEQTNGSAQLNETPTQTNTEGEQEQPKQQPELVADDDEMEYEPVPEDLKDFVVIDEAIITDSEDEEGKQWDCPANRLAPRTYTSKDLQPTEKDPRCKPDWPLAAYWPVYIGNFRLYRRYDSDYNCAHAVHKYFASKGIPSFMVFRLKDNFFEIYQKRVGFYDMLVYFCCEKDANRAIQWCHRDYYYGHRLNVYSGRTPDHFSKKTWRFKHIKAEGKLESETNLESYLRRYGQIRCVAKHDLDGVLVQFARFMDGMRTFKDDPLLQVAEIETPTARQRFVEQDVEKELLEEIANNPKFMRLRPRFEILNSLKHGVIPEIRRLWENPEVDEARFNKPHTARRTQNRKIDDRPVFKKPFVTRIKDLPGQRKKVPLRPRDHQRMNNYRRQPQRFGVHNYQPKQRNTKNLAPPKKITPKNPPKAEPNKSANTISTPTGQASKPDTSEAGKPKRMRTEAQVDRERARNAVRQQRRTRRPRKDKVQAAN